jgi:hypothetical protein
MLVSFLAYSSTLMKMEVIYSSENMVVFQWIAWHYIPEDRPLLVTINIQKLSCKLQFVYSSEWALYVNENMKSCSALLFCVCSCCVKAVALYKK